MWHLLISFTQIDCQLIFMFMLILQLLWLCYCETLHINASNISCWIFLFCSNTKNDFSIQCLQQFNVNIFPLWSKWYFSTVLVIVCKVNEALFVRKYNHKIPEKSFTFFTSNSIWIILYFNLTNSQKYWI